MILTEEQHLAHYGTPRHSGRYPWGSGGADTTRNRDFLDSVAMLRKQGLSEPQIAEGMGINTTQLRARKSIALAEKKQADITQAQRLRNKGMSNVAIGKQMNLNESSVRALLAPGASARADVLQATADMLKRQVAEKGYIDVSVHVEKSLPLGGNPNTLVGISKDKFGTAVAILREQGYKLHYIKVPQINTGHDTTIKVLGKPDSPYPKVAQIRHITEHSQDGGHTYIAPQPPIQISSRRIGINYAEDGGAKSDGVIFVRPGAKDLSLGSANYAQVRIAVDGTHYLKGMAVYKDDLPEGKDLVFNTNKHDTGRKKDAMKPMEDDPKNPFGAITRQHVDEHGKVKSALNIVNEEGDWDKWSKNLPSQMLSKQDPKLATQQLNMTYEKRQAEFDRISALTNPSVRRKLLETFADETDSAAVHLQAASLPSQATRVLLPVPSMKPNEVYAPTLPNGTRVALVRFPHGGTFEIPQVTVNNRNPEAKRLLSSSPKDAIGIHHSVAQHLSGADFDGDHVLLIPNNRGTVKSTPALENLKDFDPQDYKIPAGSPIPKITPSRKQNEMGRISNLITDMTIRGANTEELAQAVRHSMVVIDSEKHGLNFKQSEIDNGIKALKAKYQNGANAGASTLISKAGAGVYLPERKPRPAAEGGPIDKATGARVFVPSGKLVPERKQVTDKATGKKVLVRTGNMVPKTREFEKLAVTDNAHTLSSGSRIEVIYAEHSNRLKSLANTSRKEAISTKNIPYSPSAKAAYPKEVASLNAKLNIAEKNAPFERRAQVLARTQVSQRRQANPDMDQSEIKKIGQIALAEARVRVGARKDPIILTQAEWDAIQAGAISNHMLDKILTHADIDGVKKLATPKAQPKMTSTKRLRAMAMLDSGYTQSEVAAHLGVSLTTLKLSISER